MANPFGMQEVTLAQLGDETNAVNLVAAAQARKSVYQPIAVIVTDHEDTTSNLTTNWPDGSGVEVS